MVADLEALRRPLWVYAYASCHNAADAEDIVQEVFIRYLTSGVVAENLRRWLFVATKRLMIDRRRSARRRERVTGHEVTDAMAFVVPDNSTPLDDQVLRRERATRIRRALTTMTPLQRQCIRLRAQGLMLREIADQIGSRPNRVAEALARALPHLQRALDLPVTPPHKSPCRFKKAA